MNDRPPARANPEIRASYAKTVIGAAKRLPDAERDALFEQIGSELRGQIRAYGMLAWMPALQFTRLVEAVPSALAPEGARQFWRSCLALSLGRRLLAPLRVGAVALHGHTPGSLLRMTPQAWHLVSRNCGACEVDRSDDSGIVLMFSGLPQDMTGQPMQYLWEGGCLACIELMDTQGDATGVARGDSAVDVTVRWSL